MLERQIRNKINKHLKSEHWFVMPLSDKWAKGYPDLICIKDGRVIFLEIKQPDGRIDQLQMYFCGALWENGVEAYIVDSLDKVKEILYGDIPII